MNHSILTQYHLEFLVVLEDNRKVGIVRSTKLEDQLSISLEDLFVEGYPDAFIGRILGNINRALNDMDFDPLDDGGPTMANVEIGKEECVVKSRGIGVPLEIPTKDLRLILMAWTEYFEKNDIHSMGIPY